MNPEDTIATILAANMKAAATRRAAVKETVPPRQTDTCRELGCGEPALPDQRYCSKHTLVGRVPELGDEPRPKSVEPETHPCNRCGAGIPDTRCTSICDECAAPAPGKGAAMSDMPCVTCGKDVKGCFPVSGKPTPICFSCWRKTDDGKSKPATTKRQRQPKPQQIVEENWGGPCKGGCGKYISGEFVCYDCRKAAAEKNFTLNPGEVELYRGNVGNPEDKIIKQVVAVKGTSVKAEPMTWMWKERLPDGAITWIVGQPGNAKSLLTIEIAACASTGHEWPDGEKNTMGAVKVLMFCGEDDLKRTVLPRLLAAKADMSNIDFLDSKSFRGTVGDSKVPGRSIDLDQDMETLLGMIKANPGYKLLICDPITGIFGAKSINKDQEVNPILEELNTLCQVTGLTFLGVCHVPKRSTNSSMEKIAGGSSVAGKCRAAFMLSGNPDSDDKHDHLMTSVKTNLSGEKSGLKYKTVPTVVVQDGVEIPIVKIEWGEKTDMTADDVLLAQNSKKDSRDRQQDKCDAFLAAYLAEEPKRSPDVYKAAEAQGYGASTVKRSLENLKGRHLDGRKIGKGQGWWMTLPGVDFPAPKEEKLIALAADEGL